MVFDIALLSTTEDKIRGLKAALLVKHYGVTTIGVDILEKVVPQSFIRTSQNIVVAVNINNDNQFVERMTQLGNALGKERVLVITSESANQGLTDVMDAYSDTIKTIYDYPFKQRYAISACYFTFKSQLEFQLD